MTTAKELTDNLIYRAKNIQEFVVKRTMTDIPKGVVKFSFQHTAGEEYAQIFVPALTQEEAESMVDEWFQENV
jgi:hypothetical protein